MFVSVWCGVCVCVCVCVGGGEGGDGVWFVSLIASDPDWSTNSKRDVLVWNSIKTSRPKVQIGYNNVFSKIRIRRFHRGTSGGCIISHRFTKCYRTHAFVLNVWNRVIHKTAEMRSVRSNLTRRPTLSARAALGHLTATRWIVGTLILL